MKTHRVTSQLTRFFSPTTKNSSSCPQLRCIFSKSTKTHRVSSQLTYSKPLIIYQENFIKEILLQKKMFIYSQFFYENSSRQSQLTRFFYKPTKTRRGSLNSRAFFQKQQKLVEVAQNSRPVNLLLYIKRKLIENFTINYSYIFYRKKEIILIEY